MDLIVTFLIAFAIGAAVVLLWKRLKEEPPPTSPPRAQEGYAVPDGVNCDAGIVWGRMAPSDAVEPHHFHAYIYDDESTIPPAAPPTGSQVSHTWSYPNHFTLTGVPKDAGASGRVRVAVWVAYEPCGTLHYLNSEPLNCGSGSGNLELLARQRAPVEQRVATTVPHRYSVPAPGFASAALQAFNREWSLVRRGGACGQVAWDNGGNGTTAPFVELSTISLFGGEWELTFRCGDVSVRYSIPGDEWQALAANWVRFVNAAGVTGAALPPQLVVNPA